MFGIGWTEMLLIGVVALIVIGPKDLPVVMNRMGKAVSAIRRMGSEFQREINKASGLDQITDLRKSITAPLKQTAADIRKEFNKPLADGSVAPSGAITPKDPKSESVVNEIHEKVGMTPPAGPAPQPFTPFTKEAQENYRKAEEKFRADQAAEKLAKAAKPVESPAPAEAIPPAKKARAPRHTKSAAPAEAAPAAEVPPKTAKPRKTKTAAADVTGAPVASPKPRKPRAAKPRSEA